MMYSNDAKYPRQKVHVGKMRQDIMSGILSVYHVSELCSFSFTGIFSRERAISLCNMISQG